MYDNKIRLSPDVLEKANQIAQEWGLKNARAAVEAVFRKYSDEYLRATLGTGLYDRSSSIGLASPSDSSEPSPRSPGCQALNELDDLLGL